MAPRTPQWLFRGNAVFPAEGGTHARPRAPGSASTGATNGQRLDRRLCPARQSGQNEKEQRLWISIDSRIEGLNNERQWIPIDSLMKKEKDLKGKGLELTSTFNPTSPAVTGPMGTENMMVEYDSTNMFEDFV
ncbi:uncharacterized protein LOC125543588 isoform X2 [Triticum urartu]|uniref:uncharacterized protein LOC125543588 isoform X2 n=1 Tax=Triticum urartu TaxID=4572 RepID=UPI0020441E1D|nr:uncharacterized protein LOC125543588 isoform X2 [Triticum urartu]